MQHPFHPATPAAAVALCLLTLAGHAGAVVAWLLLIRREVALNAAMITADGSGDTLHDGFHQRRTWIRLWYYLACCVGGGLLGFLVAGWQVGYWSLCGLAFLLFGIFARTFNPLLNVAMGLSYKARFYCSPSPTAARWPDQYVWRELRKGQAAPTQEAANRVLQAYLNWCLGLCLLAYVASLAAAAFIN